jgi:hypothetical protein
MNLKLTKQQTPGCGSLGDEFTLEIGAPKGLPPGVYVVTQLNGQSGTFRADCLTHYFQAQIPDILQVHPANGNIH